MNYELCKRLKDVGFPQRLSERGAGCWTDGGGGYWMDEGGELFRGDSQGCIWQDVNGELVYEPTLSELIEACGKETLVLWGYNKNWFAGLRGIRNDRDSNGGILTDTHTLIIDYEDYKMGKTPEESVARLWIKLNKK